MNKITPHLGLYQTEFALTKFIGKTTKCKNLKVHIGLLSTYFGKRSVNLVTPKIYQTLGF